MQAEHSRTGGFVISPLCVPESSKRVKPPKKRNFNLPVGVLSGISQEFCEYSRIFTKKAAKSALSIGIAVCAILGFCSFFTLGTAVYCEDKPIAFASGEKAYYSALSTAKSYAENYGKGIEKFEIAPAIVLRSRVSKGTSLCDELLLASSSFSDACTLYNGNTPVFSAESEDVARKIVSGYVSDYSMDGRVSPLSNITYKKTVLPAENISDIDECRAILEENSDIKVISTVNTLSEKVIPFETETKEDPNLYIGDSVTEREGSNGSSTLTSEVIYENGEVRSSKILAENVTTAPISRVVRVGTKPKDILTTGLYEPLQGRISSEFGRRWGRNHEGIDIAVPVGTPVKAAEGGTVSFCGVAGGYGNFVKIDHGGGVVTAYAHLSKITVTKGQKVAANTQIALSGNTGRSTGPHLHFEVIKDGVPLNPKTYIKKR
ncbi:MAG: peptidoglycan DD-metalloendopeptidase family protein [Clostridia bacterium]|nr:peptidoglycan DD-metalloendopeptidase family protein [Clostridia bacterium]